MDVFQKGNGNLVTLAMMTGHIAERIGERKFGNKNAVNSGYLDGIIADAHIYSDCLDEAKAILDAYKQ